MPSDRHTIIYTHTDEAPALATRSLLPVINAFTDVAGVQVELRDISLAGRVLATFPDALTAEQRVSDDLAELGQLVTRPEANVIKLPNVSASIPQLKATIEELQAKGYPVPDYPDEPSTPEEADVEGALRQGEGLGGQPGAARGQLRPPCAALGEELREGAPATDGRVVARLEDPRRARWAPTTSAPTSSRSRSTPPTTLDGRARRAPTARHRAQGVDPGARRRDRRRHVHERAGARRVPRRADGRRPRPRTCCSRSTSRPR